MCTIFLKWAKYTYLRLLPLCLFYNGATYLLLPKLFIMQRCMANCVRELIVYLLYVQSSAIELIISDLFVVNYSIVNYALLDKRSFVIPNDLLNKV